MVAIAIRDSVYFVDFSVGHLDLDHWPDCSASEAVIAEYIITELRKYEQEHLCKFLSAGIAEPLLAKSPKLCSRLWLELDIVPLILHIGKGPQHDNIHGQKQWELKDIDEQADSMARKSIMSVVRRRPPILSAVLNIRLKGISGQIKHLSYKSTPEVLSRSMPAITPIWLLLKIT